MVLLILVLSVLFPTCNGFTPNVTTGLNYNQQYSFVINNTKVYILGFQAILSKFPPRVTVSTEDAHVSAPLMVVAQQPKQLISWQLPLVLESESGNKVFMTTSRTICHDIFPRSLILTEEKVDYPFVTVSTSSVSNVNFSVLVNYQDDFFLTDSVYHNFTISPSEPRYYFYNFSANDSLLNDDSNYNTVILEVYSEDNICMTVSIQNVTCPVFDTNEDITFRGFYETVTHKGGITIPKYKFPYGFYAVFVAKADDYDCTGGFGGLSDNSDRRKNIKLLVSPSITYNEYFNAVVITLSCIGAFYAIFGLAFFFCSYHGYRPRQMQYVEEAQTPTDIADTTAQPLTDSISVNEEDYDAISEADTDRNIRLCKSVCYLSDLARKDPRVLKHKSYLYLYNVLTVALFYGLPVVQLVITYQRVLNQTGEQDLCYYNFLCAHPLGTISDFNHVFSNSGYILLGILFLFITYRREKSHQDLDFDRQYGIPQHYGMFYAMGVSLIMEGVLSGSYHVCPNQSNFQFDSSFMYVMAVLCMVKLYQNRHPDINATAYSTFGVLAVAILLGMIGILEGNLSFWIFFTILYIVTCFYLSAQIYYLGCFKMDRGVFYRVFRSCVHDYRSGPFNIFRPKHPARMCLLIAGNCINWALAVYGIYAHQKDFALFLLGIFMANTLLYFSFYILMKCLYKERVGKLTLIFLAFSTICAISAMYFFLHKSISWSKTPAESRLFNQNCKLFRFYDYHDIWHFLSAVGMFFTFMVLLTLDDDLSHTHRSQIRVF